MPKYLFIKSIDRILFPVMLTIIGFLLSACGGNSNLSYENYLSKIGISKLFSIKTTELDPKDVGPLPTNRQIDNLNNGLITFIHFGPNTFNNREWGIPNYDPSTYNPTSLNISQWVDATQAMGSTTLVLVAKHHDGFQNWFSSQDKEYSVSNTPFNIDIVKSVADEVHKRKMKLGIYLSTWDMRWKYKNPSGSSQSYLDYYKKQFSEVLTKYGTVDIVWLDGAGSSEMGLTNEQFKELYSYIYSLSPGIVLQCASPDAAWIGNEEGRGLDANWNIAPIGQWPISSPSESDKFKVAEDQPNALVDFSSMNFGVYGGATGTQTAIFRTTQSDVRILSGWFWNPNSTIRNQNLADIYLDTVGKGSQLIVNYSPDSRGLIPDNQISAASRIKRMLDSTFQNNLLKGAAVTADSVLDSRFDANNVLDNNFESYWTPQDNSSSPSLTFVPSNIITGDTIDLREFMRKGQRVSAFKVQGTLSDGSEVDLFIGKTIGARRIIRLSQLYTLKSLKIIFTEKRGAPTISEVGFYKYSEASTGISFSNLNKTFYGDFNLEIESSDGSSIFYTLDGTVPTSTSNKYSGPINISNSTVVSAMSPTLGTITTTYTKLKEPLLPIALTASNTSASSSLDNNHGADKAVDGNISGDFISNSLFHSANNDNNPWWQYDLGNIKPIDKIIIYGRTDCCSNRLFGARIYFSNEEFTSNDEAIVAAQLGVSVYTLTTSKTNYEINPNQNARFIRIYSNYKTPLQLAEIKIYSHNWSSLSVDTTLTRQSSTHESGASAIRAVDGNINGNFWEGSVSHTADLDKAPWWETALSSVSYIDTLQIYNRNDCCSERLAGAKVYISSEPFISNDQIQVANQQGRTVLTLDGNKSVYSLKVGRFGKYIRIYSASGSPLALAEVQIKGSVEKLSALVPIILPFDILSAKQSSNLSPNDGLAKLAVDNNTDGNFFNHSVSHTGETDLNPWWEGNLTMTEWVSTLDIYNRTDCCGDRLNGAKVYVSDHPFSFNASEQEVSNQAGSAGTFTLATKNSNIHSIQINQFIRYVRIYGKQSAPLSLAEVKANGFKTGNY